VIPGGDWWVLTIRHSQRAGSSPGTHTR
jgi:hypothetical protein